MKLDWIDDHCKLELGATTERCGHLRPNGGAADLPFGNDPINLGGLRGPQGRKLGFSMFWDLGGPLGPQEGQNHIS